MDFPPPPPPPCFYARLLISIRVYTRLFFNVIARIEKGTGRGEHCATIIDCRAKNFTIRFIRWIYRVRGCLEIFISS